MSESLKKLCCPECWSEEIQTGIPETTGTPVFCLACETTSIVTQGTKNGHDQH